MKNVKGVDWKFIVVFEKYKNIRLQIFDPYPERISVVSQTSLFINLSTPANLYGLFESHLVKTYNFHFNMNGYISYISGILGCYISGIVTSEKQVMKVKKHKK